MIHIYIFRMQYRAKSTAKVFKILFILTIESVAEELEPISSACVFMVDKVRLDSNEIYHNSLEAFSGIHNKTFRYVT